MVRTGYLSLTRGDGGQNLIEACAVGKPVVIGPHTFNFAEATVRAIEAGAALRVTDGDELSRELQKLLMNPGLQQRMGAAGESFSRLHQGAAARIMTLLATTSLLQ